jgi:hypothetical protein
VIPRPSSNQLKQTIHNQERAASSQLKLTTLSASASMSASTREIDLSKLSPTALKAEGSHFPLNINITSFS